MFETPAAVKLTADQKMTLESWVHAPSTPQKIVLRSRICLLAAEGKPNQVIARELKTSRPTVILWRKRFETKGSTGIAEDAPHGRSSFYADKLLVVESGGTLVWRDHPQTHPPGKFQKRARIDPNN